MAEHAFIPQHPVMSRRAAVQAGAIGLLGLGMNHLQALRAEASPLGFANLGEPKAKACIYIFLSGGLAQHDSFDLKPLAPSGIRGEFNPIATNTPGVQICEHLPGLALRSQHWGLVRSLTHPYSIHTHGHMLMLTGRSEVPLGFQFASQPKSTDWPSISSVAAYSKIRPVSSNNLPPSVMLPERLIHWSGRTLPGAYAGLMGRSRDPWVIEASPYDPTWHGAYPQYSFAYETKKHPDLRGFEAPSLTMPAHLAGSRFQRRLSLLESVDGQLAHLEKSATTESFDQYRQSAISLLADRKVRHAIDVTKADDETQVRYGKNSYGWSLLMAFRLVEAGVPVVQVNLGNNETWDTHGHAFHRLKNLLFPPTDRALSALLDDLQLTGLLDSTIIAMAGEFGRTPRLSSSAESIEGPGRDHWAPVQTVFFAGGGVKGGTVIGSSDKDGAYPATNPQKPDNMAATIYHALGIPASTTWQDTSGRPHHVYTGEPIAGLI